MTVVDRVITDPNTMEWADGGREPTLPPGGRSKLLSEDPVVGARNLLLSFSSGNVEPRPRGGVCHASFLLEGRWIIDGKEIGPGGYMFGPGDFPNVPVAAPQGCLVFSSVLPSRSADQRTIIVDPGDVEWVDGAAESHLPAGVYHKVYHEDAVTDRKDMLVHFEPGYIEPRHVHGMTHYDTVLEGRWIIEGTEVGLGGHIFGPSDVVHGPFECPDGVLVCVSTFGDRAHHVV